MLRTLTLGLLIAVAAVPAVAQTGGIDFTIRVENVSTPTTLQLSNGDTAPAPTAPVLWVVHTYDEPLFTSGEGDRDQGLETLAEDGDPSELSMALNGRPGIVAVGTMAVPVGAMEAGPILPGHAYELEFTAGPGQKLTLAMMFGQSNDLFYAPSGEGISLFDEAGMPVSGEITSKLVLWDAGTEINQEPGLGPDQAPRQQAKNTGAAERGTVRPVNDKYTYPKVGDVIKVTVTPGPLMMGRN